MNRLTPVVKNLLIINILLLVLTYLLLNITGFDLKRILALFYFESDYFRPHQFVTHMFMHGDFWHLLFNMYALWMFGKILESVWGSKRFLFYYLFTGLGAAALHTAVSWYEISEFTKQANLFLINPTPEVFAQFATDNASLFNREALNSFIESWFENPSNPDYVASAVENVENITKQMINIPTVGASGAVFGLLLAFGMLFPNTELMLMFIPIPIKAKYFVMGYGAIELFYGVSQIPGDNVAHFAHLGGMVFGFILIKYWGNKGINYR